MTKKLDLRNYCALNDSSIRQVAELLNKSKLKTVYIMSENNQLIGSVTDGRPEARHHKRYKL